MTILFPWRMYGEFEDGARIEVIGHDEEHCMAKLIEVHDSGKHGALVFYAGLTDEEYVDGEYIGTESRVYD